MPSLHHIPRCGEEYLDDQHAVAFWRHGFKTLDTHSAPSVVVVVALGRHNLA